MSRKKSNKTRKRAVSLRWNHLHKNHKPLAKRDYQKLLASYDRINNSLAKLAIGGKHLLVWSIKLVIPDFLVGHPNLFSNIKVLQKHPEFKPLRLALVCWLVFSLIVGTSGFYVFYQASSILAEGATWSFDKSANYSFATDKIEISPGVAKLKQVDQIDDDSSKLGFGGGKYNDTEWGNDYIMLNQSGRQKGKGEYISRVIDAGSKVTWDSLAWTSLRPYDKELPNYKKAEFGYLGGNVDMKENELLLHLNETSGFITDYSGNGNQAVPYNSVAYGAEGKFSQGLKFDGVDDYLTVPDSASLNPTQAITVSAWVKPEFIAKDHVFHVVVSKRLDYELTIREDGRLRVGIINDKGERKVIDSLKGVVVPGQWNHIAMTYDGKMVIGYVNGRKKISAAQSGQIRTQAYPVQIGQAYDRYYFRGTIDEVAISSRSLSESEVFDHYLRGIARVKYQVRTCATSSCSGNDFIGPDGSNSSYYSDLFVSADPNPTIKLQNLSENNYFQYKVIFENDTPIYTPAIRNIRIGPDHYPTDSPSIVSVFPLPEFSQLNKFSESLGKNNQGAIRYQLSNDGTNWYYFTKGKWVLAKTSEQSNSGTEVNKQIANFAKDAGGGTFQFKALLQSNGLQPVEVKQVNVGYSLEDDEEEKEEEKDKPDDDSQEPDQEEDDSKPEDKDEKKDDSQPDKEDSDTQTKDESTDKDEDQSEKDQDSDSGDKKDDNQSDDDSDNKNNDSGGPTTSTSTEQDDSGRTYWQLPPNPSTITSSDPQSQELQDIKQEINALLRKIDYLKSQQKEVVGKVDQVSTVSVIDMYQVLENLTVITDKIDKIIGRWIDKNSVIREILTVPLAGTISVEEARNKVLDVQALLDNIEYLRSNQESPATTTWYTFDSIGFNILLTNPAKGKREVHYKACLPEEVREEHVIKYDEGLQLEYSEENQCLMVAVSEIINPRESKVKRVEVEDLWSISSTELVSLRKDTESLAVELAGTIYQAQAEELKKENLDLLGKIKEKQQEETLTPQEHILAFRSIEGDYNKVKENVAKLKNMKDSITGFSGLVAQIGKAKELAKGGVYAAIFSGIILIIFVMYRMWKHQMELIVSTMSVNTKTLSFLQKKKHSKRSEHRSSRKK
ncbi:MAG: LamG-like jellyroll fold domain-containing protein [Parcubacteria group bacterium]